MNLFPTQSNKFCICLILITTGLISELKSDQFYPIEEDALDPVQKYRYYHYLVGEDLRNSFPELLRLYALIRYQLKEDKITFKSPQDYLLLQNEIQEAFRPLARLKDIDYFEMKRDNFNYTF